jgi:chloramphenicol-sensitive protein RarD
VLNTVSIKAASMAYLVCPILTTVLAYFLGREVLTRRQWLAVWLSTAGCLVLAFGHLADLTYSMVIAVFYAFYLVTQRKNYGTDKINLLTIQVVFSALLLSLYGLERLSSSTVGIILNINPVMGFVIAVICYGERIDWQQAVAYGIILLSIFLFNRGNPALRGGLADEAAGH